MTDNDHDDQAPDVTSLAERRLAADLDRVRRKADRLAAIASKAADHLGWHPAASPLRDIAQATREASDDAARIAGHDDTT